jgi:pyruvate kinase
MLDSMIVNPPPTRAGLTDVANAVFDGTDAVMLSGETANGAYPVESVKTMDKIVRTIEQSDEFRTRMKAFHNECLSDNHQSRENLGIIMSRAGVETASAVKAKAIVTPTLSGTTARLLSVFRPDEPVLAVTPNEQAVRTMQLYWGVYARYAPLTDENESMILNAMKVALDTGMAGISDKIVLVAGLPLQSPNSVNTVRVIILGTILARSGAGGSSNPDITHIHGRIVYAETPDDARDKITRSGGEILVCKELTKDYIPIIRMVKGVICKEISEISDNDLREINPDLVWLTHIRHAPEKFESGLTVTIDAKQLLVYEGTV